MSRVAIVTGASRGIGRATAIRLARDFSAVAIVARTAVALAETANAIRAAGAETLALALDLQEAEACTSVVRTTLDRFGRIDALACIAGANYGASTLKLLQNIVPVNENQHFDDWSHARAGIHPCPRSSRFLFKVASRCRR